ncbi:hypothetical protein ACFY12_15565 [Streptomyces sp. NPDC001339]|uniref:hypothetical protein n=1 Tax=Streptomyces sp. NPDC001339 TaxID=3364563 RepID=UPI00369D65C3
MRVVEGQLTTGEYPPVFDPPLRLRRPAVVLDRAGPHLQDLGRDTREFADRDGAAARAGTGGGAEGAGAPEGGADQSVGVVGEHHLGQHAAP